MILRTDANCTVREVAEQALAKYTELLDAATSQDAANSSFAPPSLAVEDYIMRVARGDGLPDRTAHALDMNGVLKDQGLVFPYMVVLTLDPDRPVSHMQLTDQFKEALIRRAGGGSPSSPLQRLPFDGTFGEYSKPEDSVLKAITHSQEPTAEQLQTEKAAVQTVEEQQRAREALESRRLENLRHLEKEREERERQNLEDCEKKERERRRNLVEQRRQEEQQQLHAMEEHHKLDMAKKMEQFMKEQKQREMFEEQQKRLEKEQRDRERRHEALERERQKRQAEREEQHRQMEMETRATRIQDREKRMEQSLDLIIERLNYDIDLDNRQRMEMLERERAEREAQERMQYEREYIARVEKQRKQMKAMQNNDRLEKEARRQQQLMEKAQREAEEKAQAEEDERIRFAAWRAKKQAESERVLRMKELEAFEVTQEAAQIGGRAALYAV